MSIAMSRYLPTIAHKLREERRALGGTSPEAFARIYLSDIAHLPPSRMHREVYEALAEMTETRNVRLAIAAPRGHAKSTVVSLAYVLWGVLYGKERLVLLVSATRDQAILLLKAIKEQLERNAYLREDFPEVCPAEGVRGRITPWRDNRILLRNGAMILAYGMGQGLRGAKHGRERPGLMVADDMENAEDVRSEEQRQKLEAWFNGTLLKAGHPGTNVVVVGTVLHRHSLLAHLMDPQRHTGWRRLYYQAVEAFSERIELWERWRSIYAGLEAHEGREGPEAAAAYFQDNRLDMLADTAVLWPERESYYDLMVMREREGRASFQSEKQNEPIDPEECFFREEEFHYWDDDYPDEQALMKAIGPHAYLYGACDPSLGRRAGKGAGDYTAIVLLLTDIRDKVSYVLVADLARRTPEATIKQILQYAKVHSEKLMKFMIETNQFQDLLYQELRRKAAQDWIEIPLRRVEHRTNKQVRIQALQPYIAQGQIRFSRKQGLLLDQLRQYPFGQHDDGPDALEMAMVAAAKPGFGLSM